MSLKLDASYQFTAAPCLDMAACSKILLEKKVSALLVPQAGVARNGRGQAIVYVVDAEGKAVERAVRTDRAVGNEWLIAEGLAPGDVVVVEGLQKLRPGAPVKAMPVTAGP